MSRARRHIVAAIIATTLALCGCARAAAQSPIFERPLDGPAIGIHAGISGGAADASFAVDSKGLSDESGCGRYESGSTTGWLARLDAELSLTPMLGVSGGFELTRRDVASSYPCSEQSGIRMPDGSVAPALTEFRATTSYTLASAALGITLRPLSLPLVVGVTPSVSLCLDGSYAAREVIVSPAEASFVSGGQERSIGTGRFDSGDLSFSIGAALWYEAPISERLSIVPRIGGSIALVDEITAGGIRASNLQATLGLLYRFPPADLISTPIEAGQRPIVPR
jgi:hypothetical protein